MPVRVEFVAQVAERVGFALGVRREGRADRGEQVRPVQPHRLEFGPYPAEFGEHGGHVGERRSTSRQTPASVGVTAANPAMMSRAMSLRVVIRWKVSAFIGRSSVLVGDGLGEPPGGQPGEVRLTGRCR